METSIKSNLKFKALIIILTTMLVLTGSALCTKVRAAEENDEPKKEQEVVAVSEIKLNRTVEFTGNTYKSYREGAKVKKEFKEAQKGVIFAIRKNQPYGVYIFGKGWIAESQIVAGSSKKFVDITFKLGKEGLKSELKVEGEFTNIVAENTGIIRFENGKLIASADGTTNVVITKKDGTKINALATVHSGDITLNLPEASLEGKLKENATIADKIVIDVSGNAEAGIALENGALVATSTGNGELKVTAEGKEIIEGKIEDTKGKVTASLSGVEISGQSTQTISVLAGKIRTSLQEKIKTKIDAKQISTTAGGSVSVQDKEVVSGEGEMEYTYGEKDPTGGITINALGNKLIEKKGVTIPIISKMKALIGTMIKVVAK